MSVIKIPDQDGNTLTVIEHDGHYFPVGQHADVDVIKSLSNISIRDDDIFVCAYPKCGTHWVWEMVRLLLAGTTDGDVTEKDSSMMEFIPDDILQKLRSPRILNCHLHLDQLPAAVVEKKCKIIFIIRNPKDMAVSLYHHTRSLASYDYNGSWAAYLKLLMDGRVDHGSYFSYLKSWDRSRKDHPELPFLSLVYEDLKEDPGTGIRKLAKFLGVERSEEFYNTVEEKTSFNSMKAAKGHIIKSKDGGAPVMYRKGQVGDWKNSFTVLQNEQFDDLCRKELEGLDTNFRYTL